MDGVIVHSTPVHNEAWQVYLKRQGIRRSLESIETAMLGKHNDDIVRAFFGDGLTPEEIVRHGVDKEKVYREILRPRLPGQLVPGIAAFAAARPAMPKAVATNAEAANVSFVLEGAGLRSCFQVVVDGGQVKRPKPDPEVFLKAAGQLDLDPADCLVFEDSATGIAAAREAGAAVVGLTTTTPLDGCGLTVPDFNDPRLEAWLEERTGGLEEPVE